MPTTHYDDRYPACPDCQTDLLVDGCQGATLGHDYICQGCGRLFDRHDSMTDDTPSAPRYLTATCVSCSGATDTDGREYRTFKLESAYPKRGLAVYSCEGCGHAVELHLDP